MAIQENSIGLGNFFSLNKTGNLSPDLVCWGNIQRAYLRFPTVESLERIAALNRASVDLEKEGLVADLLIGGSLALGQSVGSSDIDVFGVVTAEPGTYGRSIIEAYQAKFSRESGRDVEFPVTGDLYTFSVEDLSEYLDSASFGYSPRLFLVGLETWGLRRFHSLYQTALGIGSCRLELVKKTETLKEDPRLAHALASVLGISGFARSFHRSFLTCRSRLSDNQEFSSLSEQEKGLFLRELEEEQYQFLFYLENPQFCILPDKSKTS